MDQAKITECREPGAWYENRINESFPYLGANKEETHYRVMDPITNQERLVGWHDAYLFNDEYELDQELTFEEAIQAIAKGWSVRIFHPKLKRNIGLNQHMGCRHLMEILREDYFNVTFQDLFDAQWKIIEKEFK